MGWYELKVQKDLKGSSCCISILTRNSLGMTKQSHRRVRTRFPFRISNRVPPNYKTNALLTSDFLLC